MVAILARGTFIALVAYTALSMALLSVFDYDLSFTVGPINIYLFDLVLAAAVALLAAEALAPKSQHIPRANRTVVFLVLAYAAYQVAVILPVSVLFHDLEPIAVSRDLASRMSILLIPFIYLVALKYISPCRATLVVATAGAALALYSIYRYATVGPMFDAGTRLRELGGSASLLFGFLILTALFLARPSVPSYLAAILGVAGIALTNHRSAYLSLLVVGVPLFFAFRRVSSRTIVVLLVAASAAILLLVTAPTIRESVYYSLRTMVNPTADKNAWDRVDRSRLAWDYFTANPWGDYAWQHRYYLVDLPDPFEPHNFVMQFLGQQGIVGFALFAAIILTTGRLAWRNRSRDRTSVVMLGCLAFYLICCLFNTNIISPRNVLLLALPAGVLLHRNATLAQREAEEVGDEVAHVAGLDRPGVARHDAPHPVI